MKDGPDRREDSAPRGAAGAGEMPLSAAGKLPALSLEKLPGAVALAEAAAIGFANLAVYAGYVGWDPQNAPQYLLATALNLALVLGILWFNGLYSYENIVTPLHQAHKIVFACAAAFLLLAAMAFMLKVSVQYSRVWALSTLILEAFLICAARICVHRLLNEWSRSGRVAQRVAIVGATEQARRLIEDMDRQNERYPWRRVDGIYDDRTQGNHGRRPGGRPVIGNLNDLVRHARDGHVDAILVAIPWSAEERLTAILDKLSVLPVHVRLAPDLIAHRFSDRGYDRTGGIACMTLYESPLAKWSHLLKKAGDVVVAALVLLPLLPAMAGIALAIKLDSRGPALFRQQRSGFNNERFEILKFRTMRTGSGRADPAVLANRNEPALTRIGDFLRRTSLDELPQIFNVLTGTMSLVGPRPHAVEHDEIYAERIPGYLARTRMKPGMTGWAQVNGFRGETYDPERMKARIDCDIHYIDNWSLLFDLKILAMTPYAMLTHALLKNRNV